MRARKSFHIIIGIVLIGLPIALLGFLNQSDAPVHQQIEEIPKALRAFFASSTPQLHEYIEVTDGCGPYFGEGCLNVRSGPGEEFPKVGQLRNGVVLKVGAKAINDKGDIWYRVVFDEWLRYPERVTDEWYVAGEYVRSFFDIGTQELKDDEMVSSTKRIVVDRSEQMLYAYEGQQLFAQESISTGLELTPTPRGSFTVYKKTPSRYMQGPLPGISEKYYDLPGVPWNLFFTHQGAVIHGAYWHDKFGQVWSSGCVNLPLDNARRLYEWAEIGMTVVVRD